MKVVLLRGDDGRIRFLSGGEDDDPGPPERRPRGRLERCLRGGQASLLRSGRRLGPTTRRLRSWLDARVDPDEPLLAGLRRAGTILLEHPAAIAADRVGAEWQRYLRRRQRRHLGRFVLNALLSPLTLVLAPLPGPNFVGYWFVYRAGCHALILLGIRRALGGSIPSAPSPKRELDRALSAEEWGRLAFAARKHGDQGFATRLAEILGPGRADDPSPPLLEGRPSCG